MGESTENARAGGSADGQPVMGSTITHAPLGELLTRLKQERGIGDARLATIANDRVGIPSFVTRSTIRNWASGNVARASNWRQLAAVASALQLDLAASDELMSAGGCDPISDLLRVARTDDAIYLVYWATEIDTQPVAEEPETPETDADIALVAAAPAHDAAFAPIEVEIPGPTRPVLALSTWLAPLGFIVIGALAAVGLWYLLSSSGSAASLSGERTATAAVAIEDAGQAASTENAITVENAEPDTAVEDVAESPGPTTTVDLPAVGVTINGDLVASGTARHPDGIEHVELIVKHKDVDMYWNPVAGIWQSEFVRFVVPVSDAATNATWSYRIPVPLASGEYRVRAWAQATSGNGDPLGPMSDFTVVNETALAVTPGAAAAPEGPNQLVVPPPEDGYPASTLDAPTAGGSSGPDVVISGTAQDPNGVAYVELILRSFGPPDQYWNPTDGVWQSEFMRFAVDVDRPGEAEVSWQWSPPEPLEAGTYRARVWAKGSDGGRDEERTLSDFTVTDAPEG